MKSDSIGETSKTFFKTVVSPLQKSLLKGSVKKIEKILREKYGAKLSSHKNEIKKFKEIVQLCLDLKINLNLPESKYSTLLHFVAKTLDVKTFKSVLNRSTGFDINSLHVENDYYPGKALLHILVEEGNENLVKVLLDFGADVNVKDARQETPLFYAVLNRKPRLVRLLQDSGGTIHYENFKLGLDHPRGLWHTDKEIVKILLEGGCDVTPENNGILPIDSIFYFVTFTNRVSSYDQYFDYWEILKLLCAHGAGMDLNNETGTKLLHLFCKRGRLDEVQISIKYGADLFSIESGSTTLHKAIFGNNFELVDFLLRNGLDINAKDELKNETPLIRLAQFNRNADFLPGNGPEFRDKRTKEFVNMIEFLVDNGADVNAFDENSCGPVERSIHLKFLDIMECFFELKAIVDFEVNFVYSSNFAASSDYNQNGGINSKRNNTFNALIAFFATKENDILQCIRLVSNPAIFSRIKSFYEKCKIQVNQMKQSDICRDRNISFFDFLTKDLMQVAIFSRDEEILRVLNSGKYERKFPLYKYFLEKRIKRVQLLRNYINILTLFLEKFFQKQLPIVVLHIIFRFLRAGDVRNFGRALRISNDFPNGKYCIE